MQSENFDNKIRDLLDQPPQGNENPDWERMELLLDKHLPQKKNDRKRFIIFLVFFLLLGSGSYLLWHSERKTPNKIASTKSASAQKNTENNYVNKDPVKESGNNLNGDLDLQTDKLNDESIPSQNKNGYKISIDVETTTKNKTISSSSIGNIEEKQTTTKNRKTLTQITGETDSELLTKSESNNFPERNDSLKSESENLNNIDLLHNQNDNPADIAKDDLSETTSPYPIPEVQKNKKPGKSFLSNIFFSVSAGPDVSTVGLGNTGQVKISAGVGIGYQFSNRLSVRTGFYTARKVYTADPEDYNPPSNFWNYYPNLKTIDANCKVYEIPVLLDYSFKPGKKGNWFVSGGVSTLLMKEETYEYYFKPNSSPNYVTYSKTYKNQNKHYFSIVDLSGGYRLYFNKKFSLQAEPYLKIATSGVGFGKVKLNSGGLLISAIVRPFARK